MHIIILPGDGIGAETMAVTVEVLNAASARFDLPMRLTHDVVGHASLRRHGSTVTTALLEKVKAADGLMLGPTATYEFKDETRGEINPSKFFRKELDLYANIRPARTWPSIAHKTDAFDLVVVRENTEGFYADRNMASGSSEIQVTPDVVVSLRRITRDCCTRIARCGFELAMRRRRRVTLVHKANVLKIGDGLFLEECRRIAQEFAQVQVDECLVDAMMAHTLRCPQRFDVIITTNMFGDILSDLTAELSGSLGLGGSLNVGDTYAMGQAAHGCAPDIAGQDVANPFSLVFSAAQLLDWHGQRRQLPAFCAAAQAIEQAVAAAIDAGESTRDVGGTLGTRATGQALVRRLAQP